MDSVPNMISTKDLDYLTDIFGWNLNASKKALCFSESMNDNDLSEIAHDISLLHADICHRVISILEGEYNE
ncbi:MAG: hypothetical protein J6D28_01715 [Bacilli bacterium]|nr:hypothetical protein [Bacilli bacterium]